MTAKTFSDAALLMFPKTAYYPKPRKSAHRRRR